MEKIKTFLITLTSVMFVNKFKYNNNCFVYKILLSLY